MTIPASLRAQADALDARTQQIWDLVKDAHRVAAVRKAEGYLPLATNLIEWAKKLEALAAERELEAFRLRQQAVALEIEALHGMKIMPFPIRALPPFYLNDRPCDTEEPSA